MACVSRPVLQEESWPRHAAEVHTARDATPPENGRPAKRLLWAEQLNVRLDAIRTRFQELAASRTGEVAIREQLVGMLVRWFVVGREERSGATRPKSQ